MKLALVVLDALGALGTPSNRVTSKFGVVHRSKGCDHPESEDEDGTNLEKM